MVLCLCCADLAEYSRGSNTVRICTVRKPCQDMYMNVWLCWASTVGREGLTQYPLHVLFRHAWWVLCADTQCGQKGTWEILLGTCSQHLVNISVLPLPVYKASCTSEASAAQNAKNSSACEDVASFPRVWTRCQAALWRLQECYGFLLQGFAPSLHMEKPPFQCTSWIWKIRRKNFRDWAFCVLLFQKHLCVHVYIYVDFRPSSQARDPIIMPFSPSLNNVVKINREPRSWMLGVHVFILWPFTEGQLFTRHRVWCWRFRDKEDVILWTGEACKLQRDK